MAALGELLERTARGSSEVLIVEGEPGIGKTRLVDELVRAAHRDGVTVLVGAADEVEPDRPFAAFAEALGLRPDDADAERAELGRLITGDTGADEAEPAGASADVGFRIVESLVALLERLGAAGPLVVVVEDAHWADPSTVRALRAVGRRALGSLPVSVVVTLRPFPRIPELDQALDDLVGRGAHRLALEPLGPQDAADLAVAAGGPGGRIDSAGGNPLLIIELATTGPDDAAVPPTVAASVRRRVRSLPAPTAEAIQVASVLGRRFSFDHLATLMGRNAVALLAALEDALTARVLGEEDGELVFRHELIREAVYADLRLPLRRGLHREAARVLATSGASPAQVAEHLLAGADPGDLEAIRGLAQAARVAAPRSPQSAVKLLERALELADPEDPQSDQLAADLAPLLIQTGRAPEAERLTRQVLARSPAAGVEGALRRALGEVLWTQGMVEAAVRELDAAARLDGVGAAARAGARAQAANLRLFLGEPEVAEREARDALAEAERLDDDFARALALLTLAVGADARAEVSEALVLARGAASTARHSADPRVGHLHPHLFLGLILFDADRLEEAEDVLQEGRRRAEERGTVAWLPLYHCVLAMRRLMIGSLDDGLAEVDTGLALAEEVGTQLYVPLLHGMAAWVAYQRGELDAGEAHMELAAQAFFAGASDTWRAEAAVTLTEAGARWPLEWGLWVAALLAEANGNEAGALAVLTNAWAVAAPLRYFLGYRLFGADLVRLAVGTGDRELAAAVVADIEVGAARSGVASAVAVARRCRALMDDDADLLVSAVEVARTSPHVMELAFTCEDAGLALARAARPAEAVAHLEEGLAWLEQAGATRPAARVEAALRALGVRHRRAGPAVRRQSGWDSLTPTEVRVARLAAQGLTNRQIGEQLFVSRRTIETHLAHAFAKLGLSSRAQLAAEVARRD